MNIGFDAKRAFLNKSGLGNYSRSLIKSLVEEFPKNNYTLFTTKLSDSEFSDFAASKTNVEIIHPQGLISKKIPAFWRSFSIAPLLSEKKMDVYHGLSNELPQNIQQFNGKKIVTIHDLIFVRYPELYPVLDREIYDYKFRKACKVADCVVAISQQTKKDLMSFYGVPENKIKVVYQSCDELFHKEPSELEIESVTTKYKLPEKYLLSVGTIEERKNLLTIVKALKLTTGIKLVVVGKKRGYFKTVNQYIQSQNLQDRVVFLENVPNEDLPVLYRKAQIFIYPSLFEGFGIPILEALASKTPVIAGNSSSLTEAGGSSSFYIEPNDFNQLSELIRSILSSSSIRTTMIDKGYEHAQKFRPKVIANAMHNIYKE